MVLTLKLLVASELSPVPSQDLSTPEIYFFYGDILWFQF